jgi:hypothetical protein
VGKRRYTRVGLIHRYGLKKARKYWRRAKTKYLGYTKSAARCKTRRSEEKAFWAGAKQTVRPYGTLPMGRMYMGPFGTLPMRHRAVSKNRSYRQSRVPGMLRSPRQRLYRAMSRHHGKRRVAANPRNARRWTVKWRP